MHLMGESRVVLPKLWLNPSPDSRPQAKGGVESNPISHLGRPEDNKSLNKSDA